MVEDRRLHGPVEELVGVAAEELVEGVLAGDVDREAAATPARTTPLLAQRRDGAGKGDRDRGVERADVDAELERVGRDHAEQLAGDEPALEVAPLRRRVARAVGRHPVRERGVAVGAQEGGGLASDQLDRLARLHEADRPRAALHELGE